MQPPFKPLRPNDRRILEKIQKDFSDKDFSARSIAEEFPGMAVETASVCMKRLFDAKIIEVITLGTRKRGNTYRLKKAAPNSHLAGSTK